MLSELFLKVSLAQHHFDPGIAQNFSCRVLTTMRLNGQVLEFVGDSMQDNTETEKTLW